MKTNFDKAKEYFRSLYIPFVTVNRDFFFVENRYYYWPSDGSFIDSKTKVKGYGGVPSLVRKINSIREEDKFYNGRVK